MRSMSDQPLLEGELIAGDFYNSFVSLRRLWKSLLTSDYMKLSALLRAGGHPVVVEKNLSLAHLLALQRFYQVGGKQEE